MTQLTLTCPEGFSYHSFQRVVCTDEAGNNVSRLVYELLAGEFGQADPVTEPDGRIDLAYCQTPPCLFVLSGESYTVADFADAADTVCGVPVRFDPLEDGTWHTTRD